MASLEEALCEAFREAKGQQQGVIEHDVYAETKRGKRIHIPAGSYVHFCNDAPVMGKKAVKRSCYFADIFVGVKVDAFVESTGYVVRVRPDGKGGCQVSKGAAPGGQKVVPHYDSGRSARTVRATLVIR